MGYQIEYAYTCHTGKVRANNEDNFWCCGESLEAENFGTDHVLVGCEHQSQIPLLAVFDGMGGESCGEMAAYLAADACGGYYREHKEEIFTVPGKFWNEICKFMNKEVCDYARENRISSMGATAAMLGFGKKSAYICNLGDSRVYRWCDDEFMQMSTDHVLAGGLFGKAPLVQFVGIPEEHMVLEPAVTECNYIEGSRYLICSDGLTDMVKLTEIRDILAEKEPVKETVEVLLKKALEAGGRDNITIVLCEVKAGESKEKIRTWLKKMLKGNAR